MPDEPRTTGDEDLVLRLQRAEALFREIFTSSSAGIAISELDGTIVEVNSAFAAIVGVEVRALVGTHLEKLFFPEDAEALRGYYREIADGGAARFRRRKRLQDPTGEPTLTEIVGAPLPGPDGTVRHLVSIVEDVSQLDLLEQQMLRRSREDELTGLPNRQRLVTELQDMIERAEPGARVALLTVDLDGFAVVNERLGRDFGDRLLQTVANKLRGLVADEVAVVARTGPDEFCVVYKEPADSVMLSRLAGVINAELAEPVLLDSRSIGVSAGIGGAVLPARALAAEELLRAADTALSRAKSSGRGQWALYDAEEDAAHLARFADTAAMPLAYENGEVTLTYQPLMGLENGKPMAVQALLRWEQPAAEPEEGEEPAPPRIIDHAECLAMAEQTGLVTQIGSGMLREACLQLRRCWDRIGGSPPVMLVALTRNFAQDPDLVSVVQRVLAETATGAESLGLSFPREVLADDRGDAVDNVETLADIGIRTSLTGAGDGLGYLEFLTDLPMQAIEMAPSIVGRLARDDHESVLAKAVARQLPLVRELPAHVVVHDIATAEQAAWWAAAGASFASGPFFAAPMSGPDLIRWLRDNDSDNVTVSDE